MTPRRTNRSSAPRPFRAPRQKSYRVICSGCGKEVIIQVAPPPGKALFCLDCFKK